MGISVLNWKFIEEGAMWGGRAGPRSTPPSASVSRVMPEPDQGVRRGRGRPPHRELCGELLTQDTGKAGQRRGMTLVELIVAFTILLILSSMAVPLARSKVRREKERELRIALVEMRKAIDRYKDDCDKGKLTLQNAEANCYPESLEAMVEGVKGSGQNADTKIKYLRRIPKDPMMGSTDWGKRNMKDDPKSNGWGGTDVFDVYSKSDGKAADGTPYSEW